MKPFLAADGRAESAYPRMTHMMQMRYALILDTSGHLVPCDDTYDANDDTYDASTMKHEMQTRPCVGPTNALV